MAPSECAIWHPSERAVWQPGETWWPVGGGGVGVSFLLNRNLLKAARAHLLLHLVFGWPEGRQRILERHARLSSALGILL